MTNSDFHIQGVILLRRSFYEFSLYTIPEFYIKNISYSSHADVNKNIDLKSIIYCPDIIAKSKYMCLKHEATVVLLDVNETEIHLCNYKYVNKMLGNTCNCNGSSW